MSTKTTLRWSYHPSDFFEVETPEITTTLGAWSFHDGTATLRLPAPLEPVPPEMLDSGRAELGNLLRLRAVLINRSWLIVGGTAVDQHSNSGVSHTIVPITGSGVLFSLPSRIDIQQIDDHGNVISDTAKDRRTSEAALVQRGAERLARSPDLQFLYDRYSYALNHPEKDFVDLFAIIDRLETIFGGTKAMTKALKVRAARDILGTLANKKPIIEGRHLGEHELAKLRPATQDERTSARAAALKMIRAYEAYLDAVSASSPP